MACERNRILKLVEYFESCGIEVNLGKNKARGNKGFFRTCGKAFRIDIAKGLTDEVVLRTLAHEFAHFVHYKYDKKLSSLDFFFDNIDDNIIEELLSLTVDSIPKSMVKPLFDTKYQLKTEIKNLTTNLKNNVPNFKLSEPHHALEQKIKNSDLRYLLKYDKVKVINCGIPRLYTIEELSCNTNESLYLKIKSKQRALKRINSRISKLNRYYNSLTELFARSFELYIINKNFLETKAPKVFECYSKNIQKNKIPLLNSFINLYN